MTKLTSSRFSGGAIGGIAVGACAGILLLLFGVFLWWRRSHRQQGSVPVDVPLSVTDYSTGPVTFHTPSLPTAVPRDQTSTTSEIGLLQPSPTPNSTPSSPHSNSSASNSNSGSGRLILHNPSPSLSGSGHGGTQSSLHEILSVSESAVPYQSPAYVCISEGS